MYAVAKDVKFALKKSVKLIQKFSMTTSFATVSSKKTFVPFIRMYI